MLTFPKIKKITPYLSPWNFVTDVVVLFQEKTHFFSVNTQRACNWEVYHKLHKIMNKLKEYISYYKFWWVILLSIFTSCAVFDKPVGQVKIKTKSKNTKQYCTPKHLKCVICYPTAFSMQSVFNHFSYGKKSKANRES